VSDGLDYFSAVLQHGAVSAFREVEREHFIDEEELRVYDYVANFMRMHRTLPQMETVALDCNVELEEQDEPVSYYRTRLYDRRTYNGARAGFGDLREALASGDSTLIHQAITRLNVAAYEGRRATDLMEIEEADRQLVSNLRERNLAADDQFGIPTGWSVIDEDTGGYRNGDLVGWIGRPAMGKTYMLLYQALNAWRRGHSVLFVSMEMPIEAINVRLAGLRSNVDTRFLRRGRLSSEALRRVVDATETDIRAQPFHIYSGNFGRSITDITTLMTELTPDVVYIDGIYRLLPVSAPRNTNRYERVAFVLDEAKGIALEHDRPIVYTLQFNREGAKSSSLENIGYSDAAGQHSSLVYAIEPWVRHRENRINLDVDPKTIRVVRTIKGREGESAIFAMNYSFRPVDFSERTDIYIGRPPDSALAESARANTDFMLPRSGNENS
jgi:replicative DNA helicase